MKKLFAILAVCTFMVACNNDSTSGAEKKDTLNTMSGDSSKMENHMTDSSSMMGTDTMHKMDSSMKK